MRFLSKTTETGWEMKILTGLFEQMVIRRNADGVSEQPFTGECSSGGGQVKVSVCGADGGEIEGMTGRVCGRASAGKFSGVLEGLKAGGPYRITVTVGKESLTLKDVLVGDVWVLGGQSNMQGYGNLSGAYKNSSPMVRAYYMDDRWCRAEEPITCPPVAHAPVHWRLRGVDGPQPADWKDPMGKGAGPGVSFANEMFRLTGVPQGLICCAHGGTTMAQWDPKLKKDGDNSLYGAMLNRVKRNGGFVSGMIWYQGCSDAKEETIPLFRQNMIRFVKALRRDFRFPGMPFVQVQIARLIYTDATSDKNWTCIREIQRTLQNSIRNLLTVPAIDLELDDGIHLSGKSQIILGRRLAEAAYTLTGGKDALPPPIELDSVKMKCLPKINEVQFIVSFKNVAGELVSAGRPVGFMFNTSQEDLSFRTELKGNTAILHCGFGAPAMNLGYGCCANPCCNIHDSAGRSLPAFTWQLLFGEYFKTPYTAKMQVSEPLFGTEELDRIKYADSVKLSYSVPPQKTFVIPPDHTRYADRQGVRFFRSVYDVPEPMQVRLLFGYDGPVKMFVDGKAVYTDKNGTNPIVPEQHHLDAVWEKGRHEVMFALALHHGAAWGVSLDIARTDLKRTKRNAEQEVTLPVELD